MLTAAAGWLDLDAFTVDRGGAALAVVKAVESAPTKEVTDLITVGLQVVLGKAGIAAQMADSKRIAASGKHPLCVALFEHQGATVTVMVTTIAVPARILH